MAARTPMPMCPMAGMCKDMMDRRTSHYALIIPGVLLIILGITVLIEPRILAWLVAIALIVMGSGILMMTKFIRGMSDRIRDDNG